MLIVIGLIFIGYGWSQISLKDFWWWDNTLLWQSFGRTVERTERWELWQDMYGSCCVGAGVFALVYYLVTFIS